MKSHISTIFSWQKVLTALVLFCAAGTARAQVNTYGFNHSLLPPPYVHISGGRVAQATGATGAASLDDVSYPVTLPFTFHFGNVAYTTVNISTNGSVSFGTNATTSTTAINDNTPGGGVIAAFNTDLRGIFTTTATTTSGSNTLTGVAGIGYLAAGQTITGTGIPSGTTISSIGSNTITMSANATATSSTPVTVNVLSGRIDTVTTGTAPNRNFIIEWSGFQINGAANTFMNFQIRLLEAGGIAAGQEVHIFYGEYLNAGTTGTVQVGLRGHYSNADFSTRVTSSNWASTAYGTASTNTMPFSPTNMPTPTGLWYIYTPPPACSGTPVPGTVTATPNPVCVGNNTTLALSGTTTGTGISIQWMSSTDNITFTNIPGAIAPTHVATAGISTVYYKAEVRCNGANLATSNTVTVTVSNPPVYGTLPFKESFESWASVCNTNERPGNSWIVTPNTGNASWRRDNQGSTASWTTPATGAYTPVSSWGSNSARFHSAGAASGLQGTMDAYVNLSPAGTKIISFDHINTSGTDTLFVELSTDGGLTFTRLGFVRTNTAWTNQSFSTTATASNAVIRLRAKSDGGTTDIGVDNFSVTTCLAPTGLTATTTPSGATLGYTAGSGTPAVYQIQWGTSTFTLGTGTNVFTASNTHTLSGLSTGQNYSFFVRAVCSAGDTSAWSARQTFSTTCSTATLPFAESFNTYLPSNCWTEATGMLTASSTLTVAPSDWTGANYLNSTSNPAARILLNSNTRKDWLISPSIDLGTPAPGTSFALEFNAGPVDINGTPTGMGSDDSMAVVISTDNGLTWSKSNIVKLFTAANTPVSASGGLRFAIPLEGYSGVIRIGFYGTDGANNNSLNSYFFIDEILVANCTRPVVRLGNDTVLCPAQTITLDAGHPGSTYRFSNNATTQTTGITAAGTYSVELIDVRGCIGRDTINISAGSNPVVNLGRDTTICPRDTITLNAGNPGLSFSFSNGATTQTTRVTTGNTYTVAVTNANKCVGRDTIVIGQAVDPVVNLGNDTVLCPAQTITLDAGNAGSTYLYNTGAVTRTLAVTTAGTYSVRVTNATKCVARDTIVITAGSNPVVNLGRDTLLCPGDTIRLNAGNPGSTYLYSTGATTRIAPITTGGTYTVAVTNTNLCVGRDTIVISNGVNPAPRLGNDTVLCPNQTITLNGGAFGAGFTYLYSNNATTQTTNVTTAGTYRLLVTNTTTGCRGRDTIVISSGVDPVVNLGNDTAICPGKLITLNAGNVGSTYLYNTGVTTRTMVVTSAGTYSVRVTNATKCVTSDTIVIAQGVDPIVNLGPDTSICQGTAYTLDAGNPGARYLYNTGATTQTLAVIPSGTYSVAVTNAQNCVGYDTVNVTVNPLPVVNSITQAKAGMSVTFGSDAMHANTYAWTFGDNSTSTSANPVHAYTANGSYSVMLVITNDCGSDTARTTVTVSGVGTGDINADANELSVYPNPAVAAITIEHNSPLKMQSLSVLNSLGAVVLRRDGIDARKETLDVSALPAGSYLIRVQTDAGAITRRIQIMK